MNSIARAAYPVKIGYCRVADAAAKRFESYNPYPADSRNDNTTNEVLDQSSKYLVVGAGSITGFKSYNTYSWLRNSAKAFLALEYLANEYE